MLKKNFSVYIKIKYKKRVINNKHSYKKHKSTEKCELFAT